MAIAAVVPIIGQVAALVAPLLPDIIRGVEQVFRAPQSGADRMDVIASTLRAIVSKAVARGEVAAQPSDEELRALVEATFQRMKAAGELSAAPPMRQTGVFLFRGTLAPVQGFE